METFNATSQGVRLWDKNIGKAQLNGGLVYTRAAAKDANGRFGWVRDNASCFTDTATPAFEAPVYSSTAATDSSAINIVTVPGDDQITVGGSGLLLQPITELQYVSMTAASGIVSNGNTLTFDGTTAWTDGGLGAIVSGSFCPLEKVNSGALGGNTQYANMYTGGIESAVVTELPGSTGYGTLVNVISTITSVRPTTGTNSATNSYIPTERAVALALAGKENIIVGGACVDVTKDVFSTTVAVKTQSGTLPTLANAVDSRVPTERCARQAIDVTSEVLNASASALSNSITTLSTYVIDSTVKKTDYATDASAGIVEPTYGLALGDNGLLAVSKATVTSDVGNISAYQGAYTLASGSAIGGVVCTNKIESAGLAAYKNEPIVPTVQAVWDYVSEYGGGGGGAIVSQGTGISVTSDTPLTSYTVTLSSALENTIGGVKIPSGSGLVLENGGKLSLAVATVHDSKTTASTSEAGGVRVLRYLTDDLSLRTSSYVPNNYAVTFAHGAETPFLAAVQIGRTDSTTVIIHGGEIYDSNYALLGSCPSFTTILTATDPVTTLYAHVYSNTTTNSTYASINTAAAPATALYNVPLAKLIYDGTNHSALIEQYRTGNIVLSDGGGGYTTITQGTGIQVTGASDTGYTVALSAALNNTIGGVMVPANGGLTLVTAEGATKGALRLNKAGTTQNTYGGVWVPTGSGLTVITATTDNGKLYLNTAPLVATYADAVTSSGAGNIGGVVVYNGTITGATTSTESSCPVVPTVDAVYQALQTAGGQTTVSQGTGISVTGTAVEGYTVGLNEAQTDTIGGVSVPAGSGLEINAGTLKLDSTCLNYFRVFHESVGDNATQARIVVTNFGVVDSAGEIIYYNPSVLSGLVSRGVNQTKYATITHLGNLTVTNPTARSSGYFMWTSGTSTVYTLGASPAINDPVFSAYTGTGSGSIIGHVVESITGGTMTIARWSASVGTTSSATTANKMSFPIAEVSVDGGGNVKIHQFQRGPVVSGYKAGGQTTVSQTSGISVTGTAIEGYTVGLSAATTASIGGVIVGAGLAVDENGKISVTGGGGAGEYNGPFDVEFVAGSTETVNVVSGGYVKWLDGNTSIGGSNNISLPIGSALYLVGSSGAVAGETITANSYKISITSDATTKIFSRTTSAAVNSRYKWISGAEAMYTPDFVPTTGTLFYTTSAGTSAWGSATAYNYNITIGGVVYSKTQDDTLNTNGWFNRVAVRYTSGPWPAVNDKTLYATSSSFDYTTTSALPPAGAFYTILAENSGGTMKQQQYGTVWHEHWGDDYKGQFAISRVARTAALAATTVPELSAHLYKYIVAIGGRLYGGIDFNKGRIWEGMHVSGGIIMAPGDIMYPTSSVPNVGTVTGGTYSDAATSSAVNDGLYFPYGETGEVWMNIWSGTWPAAYGGTAQTEVTSQWWTVAHPQCLEGYIPNCYSVQLGWVTLNGAPQQEHKGAIAIRGRWA